MTETPITTIPDSELDDVGAGRSFRLAVVGVFAAVQTNASAQTSVNALAINSGNQYAVQGNNASIN